MSQWHYSKSGQQQGPVSSEQLKQLAASGQLQPSDLVWKEGMGQWAEARRMKGLFPDAPTADSHVPPPMPSENDATARPSDSVATQSPAALRQKVEGLRQSIIQQVLNQSSDLPDAEPIATFRKGYADQQERLNQLKKWTQDLGRAKAEYEVLDNACQQKAKELAATEANLKQFDRPLGKAAFEGVVLGQVQNQQVFSERSALQDRIGELRAEHDRLSPSSDAGMLQKTKAKAQQLVVVGKIKLEETKIGRLEEQIGRQLIGSNQEDSVRCEHTTGVLAELAKHREVVAHRKRECDEARKALDQKKQQLATTLKMTNIEGIKSFNAERQSCEAQITQIENQRNVQEAQLMEWLLASEIQGTLGQLLGELRDAQARLVAASQVAPPRPRKGSQSAVCPFGEWYRTTWLGRKSLPVQIIVWLLYGFLWIPCWYLWTATPSGSLRGKWASLGTGEGRLCGTYVCSMYRSHKCITRTSGRYFKLRHFSRTGCVEQNARRVQVRAYCNKRHEV